MMKRTKKVIAGLAVFALLVAECGFLQADTVLAGAVPTTAKTITIMTGSKKILRVRGKNIISMKFKSSESQIASISNKGMIKAKKAGKCRIKTTVEYKKARRGKKIYKRVLTTKVTVKKTPVKPTSSIKPTKIPDVVQTVEPSAIPDITTMPTATPSNSVMPSETLQALIVSTQRELEEALTEKKVRYLMLQTDLPEKFTIPEGQHQGVELTVNAPNADIINKGVFKSVTIQGMKADMWTEQACGNEFTIIAEEAHILVSKEADIPRITLPKAEKTPRLSITVEGTVGNISLQTATLLTLDGKTGFVAVVVEEAAKDTEITAGVPVQIRAKADLKTVLEKGAEGSIVTVDALAKPFVKIFNNTSKLVKANRTDGTSVMDILAGEEGSVNPKNLFPSPSAAPTVGPSETPSTGWLPSDPNNPPYATSVPTSTPESTLIPTPTGKPVQGENAGDVKALTELIQSQKAMGATVSEDLDSDEYVWSRDGRLLEVHWDEKNLKGNLEVSGFRALQQLDCSWNNLSNLDASTCIELVKLDCKNNELNSLDVSNCTALAELFCDENELSSIDVSDCIALTKLSCYGNKLNSLDVSNCTALTELSCDENELSSLDISTCIELVELSCGCNQLNSLDVSNCTALAVLFCHKNELSSLDISKCTALTSLVCDHNELSSLDVSNCTRLTDLECPVNKISTLDVSKCVSLTLLMCWDNQLSDLDISKCTVLRGLSCGENKLSRLDVDKCSGSLEYLFCDKNNLSSLDVSKCKLLKKLDCSINNIVNLDVSASSNLNELFVDKTVNLIGVPDLCKVEFY